MDMEVRQLACAVMYQAAKDYVYGSARNQKAVLKDLRSSWMQYLTDGTSLVVAEQLERNEKEIYARIHKHEMEAK